jgi:hypothetical protein
MVEYGGSERGGPQNNSTVSPEAAVEWVIRQREPGIYIFKDLHPFKDSPAVTRCLRDAIVALKGTRKTIVLMSPVQEIPIELEKEVVVLDFPLPSMGELDEVLSTELNRSRGTSISTEDREKLLKAALGLTRDEAEKVYRKARVVSKQLTVEEVDIVLSEKKQLIRRNGILEFMDVDETIDSVGGLEELKYWLTNVQMPLLREPVNMVCPNPKGC